MRFGDVELVGKPVSRLALGVLDLPSEELIAAQLDAFFEAGGNAIDTAWIYHGGEHERIVGRWLESRGVRDEAVVVSKGAHTPHCTPEAAREQLAESLDRLRTDHIDLYLLHRDNPEVPVGEFVEALNEEQRLGRIRSYGVSNWSVERFVAARAFATDHDLNGPAVLCNQLSLARMVQPLFDGCTSVGDPASRAWLTAERVPLLAFSSQARGFFDRADERFVERIRLGRIVRVATRRARRLLRLPAAGAWQDDELARCWYSRDNFARLMRVRSLAVKRGVTPTAIAAAYVLCQPFPTFALIGPRDRAELAVSIAALDLELSAAELDWLDRGQD